MDLVYFKIDHFLTLAGMIRIIENAGTLNILKIEIEMEAVV